MDNGSVDFRITLVIPHAKRATATKLNSSEMIAAILHVLDRPLSGVHDMAASGTLGDLRD